MLDHNCLLNRYVIEDRSPYRRMAKQNGPLNRRAGKTQPAVMNMDDDDGWSFSSFTNKDAVKDSIPDQQLNLQELILRYPSKHCFSFLLIHFCVT